MFIAFLILLNAFIFLLAIFIFFNTSTLLTQAFLSSSLYQNFKSPLTNPVTELDILFKLSSTLATLLFVLYKIIPVKNKNITITDTAVQKAIFNLFRLFSIKLKVLFVFVATSVENFSNISALLLLRLSTISDLSNVSANI